MRTIIFLAAWIAADFFFYCLSSSQSIKIFSLCCFQWKVLDTRSLWRDTSHLSHIKNTSSFQVINSQGRGEEMKKHWAKAHKQIFFFCLCTRWAWEKQNNPSTQEWLCRERLRNINEGFRSHHFTHIYEGEIQHPENKFSLIFVFPPPPKMTYPSICKLL